MEHRRVAARSRAPARMLSAAVEAYSSAPPSVPPPVSSNKRKPLSLEEPYVIQPTATVFHKLYQLLVRSLAQEKADKGQNKSAGVFDSTRQADRVLGGEKGAARSRVLSLLQIMRANFCRLVDAHVDPAEVGLLLGPDEEHHWPVVSAGESAGTDKQDSTARVLPDILRCLQGIMLQDSESSLLRAAVDTISSGLPLLLPQVKDRLHLLLALVRHLKRSSNDHNVNTHENAAMKDDTSSVAESVEGKMNTEVPRERVTLLRDLLRHFARTESVLQLLALFEENEAERDAVSNLFELMLTSMADKACLDSRNPTSTGAITVKSEEHEISSQVAHSGEGENPNDQSSAEGDGDVGAVDDSKVAPYASHWEELVASGAGGTTLNFTLLEAGQQHLLWMVLSRDRTQENPHELLLCQYGQCLLQVRFMMGKWPRR